MMRYHYTMVGTAADDQTWGTTGKIAIEAGDFSSISEHALRHSFNELTQGKAVFGRPGIGCKGPYKIQVLLITLVD